MNVSNTRFSTRTVSERLQINMWLAGACLLIPAGYLLVKGQLRILTALICLGTLLISWMLNRTIGIAIAFTFLLILGDLRRLLDMAAPTYGGLDLLIAVGPVFIVFLTLPLLLRVKLKDIVSKTVLALIAMMLIEVFNPRQGGIAVGAGGAMFFIVPLCWFWVGRAYATDRMLHLLLYRVVLPIGILDGMLGIAQAYVGFFPWEKAYALAHGSLFVYGEGHLRSFGFSTGPAEFASTLLISGVFVGAAIFAKQRSYVILLAILLVSSVLASSRGLIVRLVFGLAMIWAVRGKGGRNWLPRLVLGLVLGFGLVIYSASHAGGNSPTVSSASTAQIATEHVTRGLANPLDERSSTAGFHWQLFVGGIVKGFTYPIGTGIGAVTLAAGKFGQGAANIGSSEIDISDVFITTGFVGGFLYLFLLYKVFRLALDYRRDKGGVMSLAYIGLLSAMVGQWLASGQYSTGPVVWFCIGALVQQQSITGSVTPDLISDAAAQRLEPVHAI